MFNLNNKKDYSGIIVFKEKHDDLHYVFNTFEDKLKIAVKVLRDRYNTGYTYPTMENINKDRERDINWVKEDNKSPYIELSDEEVENLPDIIKEVAVESRKQFDKVISRIEEYHDSEYNFVSGLERLMKSDDPIHETVEISSGNEKNLPLVLLNQRSDQQYESFRVIESCDY